MTCKYKIHPTFKHTIIATKDEQTYVYEYTKSISEGNDIGKRFKLEGYPIIKMELFNETTKYTSRFQFCMECERFHPKLMSE